MPPDFKAVLLEALHDPAVREAIFKDVAPANDQGHGGDLSDNFIARTDGASPLRKRDKMRTRANGPYPHHQKFRIVITAAGKRSVQDFHTKEEAQAEVNRINRQARQQNGLTIQLALNEYELELRKRGNRPAGIRTTVDYVRRFFRDSLQAPGLTLTNAEVKVNFADLEATQYSRNTIASMVGMSRTFVRWCSSKKYMRPDVMQDIRVLGRKRRGSKPQLRRTEARLFLAKCMERIPGDLGALCAASLLLTGIRAGELTERVGRDVDDGVLWITGGKTETSTRQVAIPGVIRKYLQALALQAGPTGRLLPINHKDKKSRVDWLRRQVERICMLSGVPVVGNHGLRATFASLAFPVTNVPQAVADTLGHGSITMTTGHYATSESVSAGEQARMQAAIAGTFPGDTVTGSDSN